MQATKLMRPAEERQSEVKIYMDLFSDAIY